MGGLCCVEKVTPDYTILNDEKSGKSFIWHILNSNGLLRVIRNGQTNTNKIDKNRLFIRNID